MPWAKADRKAVEPRSDPFFRRVEKTWRDSANLLRDSFLRVALSAKAPRHARICRYLQFVCKQHRLAGGERRIRTPETLQDSGEGV